jgi:hypothetical protein
VISAAEAARAYLAEAGRKPVRHLPPSALMRELADARKLIADLLAVIDGEDSNDAALAALARAHATEADFAGFLAQVLAALAARLGSAGAVTAGRPGSWEASLVDQLLHGTVGDGQQEGWLMPGVAELADRWPVAHRALRAAGRRPDQATGYSAGAGAPCGAEPARTRSGWPGALG